MIPNIIGYFYKDDTPIVLPNPIETNVKVWYSKSVSSGWFLIEEGDYTLIYRFFENLASINAFHEEKGNGVICTVFNYNND